MLILHSGDTFAGCRILALCGSGGMGTVYLVQDALDRRVALKIVAMCDAERELQGIRRYIRVAGCHANLLQIHHAGIEQDMLYYIMEAADPLENSGQAYVPKTLASVLNRYGKLDPQEALTLIRDLSGGLDSLHGSGLVHRDIKPENIIYVHGVPKLCDPGLVTSSEVTASLVGTLGYLPHECFDGQNLNTPGRDIYALGKVFYVAVTGEPPSRFPYLPPDLPFSVRRKLWPLLIRTCDSNPKHRFRTARDFGAALPAELPRPGRLEQMLESFRQWRLAHPGFLPLMFLLLSVLLLSGGTGTVLWSRQQMKHAEYLRECREQCVPAEKRFREKENMLSDQLSACGEEACAKELRDFLRVQPSDPAERLVRCRGFDERLQKIAARLLPRVPDQAAGPGTVRLSDAVRGLLASPLGGWIEPERRRETVSALGKLERQVFLSPRFRPGSDFLPDPGYRRRFVYVPAGVFRNRKGELVRIPRAFWCSDGELRCDDFTASMKINVHPVQADMPMVRLLWNDLLEYCYLLTMEYKGQGILPDGYICRPLFTHEWQWVCRGAWAGTEPGKAFPKGDPKGKVRPVRSGEPNRLGICDMLGNVYEITVPDSPGRLQQDVELCGLKGDPEYSSSYKKYQFLPPKVGSRIAFAPGNMDYFERELWITERRHAAFGGRHYELLLSNQAMIELAQARSLCELLGGHLLVPESQSQLDALCKAFPGCRGFPTSIDGSVENGIWVRPDGTPYTGVRMPEIPKHARWSLVFHRGSIRILEGSQTTGLICQWSEAEYRNRTRLERIRKCKGILHSFRDGKSFYVLFPFRAHNHTAWQIALILGGRLAEPRDARIRKRFQRELAPWKDQMIMMGGVWKFGKWVFQDGSELDLKLTLKGGYFLESNNPAAPGLLNGQYGTLQQSRALLLEFPLE